jgi:hypothetical protein
MNDTATRISPPGRLPLWFAMLGGAVAWMAQFLVYWSLTEGICAPGIGGFAGPNTIRLLIVVVGAIAAVISIAAGVIAYQHWRRFSRDKTLPHNVTESRRFVTLSGILLNTFFTFVIVATMAPVFVLPCD